MKNYNNIVNKVLILTLLVLTNESLLSSKIVDKEAYMKTADGRTLYVAKDENGNAGVIDSNDKVIVPFRYFSGLGKIDDYNAYFTMYYDNPDDLVLELFDHEGNKLIDKSKGYNRLYKNDEIPGYLVYKNGSCGLLDYSFQEILSPIYEEISVFPLIDLQVIATKKHDIHKFTTDNHECELREFNGLVIHDNQLYEIPIRGMMLPLTNLNFYDEKNSQLSEEFQKAEFITLYHAEGTPENEKSLPEGFYWNVHNSSGIDKEISGNYYLRSSLLETEHKAAHLKLYEKELPNEYISFDGTDATLITFCPTQNAKKYFTPNHVNALEEALLKSMFKNPHKSNYSEMWIEDLKYMIKNLKGKSK